MKKLQIVSISFLLFALYLASGVSVFANTEALSRTITEEKHSLQTDTHAAALFIEEIGPSEIFQPLSERNSFLNNICLGAIELSFNNRKGSINYPALLVRDQRKLISQYVFPFHFFW